MLFEKIEYLLQPKTNQSLGKSLQKSESEVAEEEKINSELK
jgi:hypothetical protein